jgi:hypothetical protein
MSGKCEKLGANLESCNCTYKGCPRSGNCCACIRFHLQNHELPACAFPAEVEKTWDRSFERFIKTHG